MLEVISKLLKKPKALPLRLVKGAFSVVTLPPSHKAVEDKPGSNPCRGAALAKLAQITFHPSLRDSIFIYF